MSDKDLNRILNIWETFLCFLLNKYSNYYLEIILLNQMVLLDKKKDFYQEYFFPFEIHYDR
jgi:hypothetical protein